MERVSAPDGVRARFGHHGRDPVGPISGNVRDGGAPLLPELVEEPAQGGLVPPGCGPHQPARVVVHDHGEVPVAPLVGDLIDPDPPQVREPVVPGLHVLPDPGDDRPDGTPRDPHQLRHRGLRALGRQPRDLLIEHPGVARTVPRPGHRGHRHPMLPTRHPRRLRLQHHLDRAQIQGPPPPPTLSPVIRRAPAPAPTAPATGASPWPDMRDQHSGVLVELDVLHDRLVDPEQPTP